MRDGRDMLDALPLLRPLAKQLRNDSTASRLSWAGQGKRETDTALSPNAEPTDHSGDCNAEYRAAQEKTS